MKFYFIILLFSIISINANAQFVINSNETVQIDSSSQEEREALCYYKNYPNLYFNNPDFNTTKKYKFTAYLTDGRVINFKSQINFSENKHFIIYKSEKIYPENTIKIVAHFVERDYDFTGIPNDSCWLFLTNDDIHDPIYTYSFLPEDKRKFITFAKLKDDNNPPILLNKESIMDMVKVDKTAFILASKGQLINALKQYNVRYFLTYK